jgi:single-stranded-DNA-specific exonuclease
VPRWRVAAAPDAAAVRLLAGALALPLPLAALLVQRGFHDADDVRAFLRPRLDTLANPCDLLGMADACAVIADAVHRRQTILVHGDYDVDGQCATAVLTRTLRYAGADVHAFLPHRMADGYDFGPAGLAEADRINATLIITCDCGMTAVDAVAAARAANRHVIVTDHHLPGATLPAANAIVNPQQPGDTSGLHMLCGTGVAFKLVQALIEPLGLPEAWAHHLLDFVTLATVADVVPLVGENRILVKHGLRLLARSRWPGLRALVDRAHTGAGELRAAQVGYVLGPRLNAIGRIADANDGLQLLLTDESGEADRLADRLEQCNRERQLLDARILDQALEMIDRDYADPDRCRALVLAGDGWHPGVVGIVASRIVERVGRPTFLISTDGDTGRGSGRSIDGFDLHHALTQCADLLVRYGGHRMAAGLTITRDRIPEFRERFNDTARAQLASDDLGPVQRVDLEVTLDEVTDELERWGRHLEPCGMGNPAAVFGVRNVRLERVQVVGRNHLKGTLSAGAARLDTIAFGWGDRCPDGGTVDAAFRLERNEWNGRSSLQARALSLGAVRA